MVSAGGQERRGRPDWFCWGFGLSKKIGVALGWLDERSALLPLPGAPPSPFRGSRQFHPSRSHAALSTSSVAVLALARHSSAFRRYRSASAAVMPYHARRADPFQAVSLFWYFRRPAWSARSASASQTSRCATANTTMLERRTYLPAKKGPSR
jgi:hypothetical protein